MAVSPYGAALRLGVTADSEAEAREKFHWTVGRWLQILASGR